MLGQNGASKTTLLRHAVGLLSPTKGRCVTLGQNAMKLHPEDLERIGFVDQGLGMVDWMTAGQLIRYTAAFYPAWNANLEKRLVEEFEIPLK